MWNGLHLFTHLFQQGREAVFLLQNMSEEISTVLGRENGSECRDIHGEGRLQGAQVRHRNTSA